VRIDTLNVRDTLYHLSGGGGNTLALIDENSGGVVLIDTKLRGWSQPMRDALEAVTALPVTTIINTHAHGDHTGSNGEFPTAVQIVAH
jgi:glyoxylase-like metal-dependent hydrolase (beta-lactamase superfamily II)